MTFEELVIKKGFESEKEFHKLVSSPDISSPETFERFNQWKQNDGTKQGLIKAFPELHDSKQCEACGKEPGPSGLHLSKGLLTCEFCEV